jgi:hypothetical protein
MSEEWDGWVWFRAGLFWMGLEWDDYSKILDDGRKEGGIEGSVVLEGPQGGTKAAEKSRGIDGCRDFLLDGPQRGRSTRCPDKSSIKAI